MTILGFIALYPLADSYSLPFDDPTFVAALTHYLATYLYSVSNPQAFWIPPFLAGARGIHTSINSSPIPFDLDQMKKRVFAAFVV